MPEYRNFAQDLESQRLREHASFIEAVFPNFFTFIECIADQKLRLKDLRCGVLTLEDVISTEAFVECKTDSKGHATRYSAIELASNLPYYPEFDRITYTIGKELRYKRIYKTDTEVHSMCIELCNGALKSFPSEHLGIGLDNRELAKHHSLSYSFSEQNEFFLLSIRELQTMILQWIETGNVIFCLGHTKDPRTKRRWWALNLLLSEKDANKAGLIKKEAQLTNTGWKIIR